MAVREATSQLAELFATTARAYEEYAAVAAEFGERKQAS